MTLTQKQLVVDLNGVKLGVAGNCDMYTGYF